jgi:hypothetical protein
MFSFSAASMRLALAVTSTEFARPFPVCDKKERPWVSIAGLGHARWSANGKSLFFFALGNGAGIFRVALDGHQPRKIMELGDLRLGGTMGPWMSLTPNEELLLLRDIGGGTELYALHGKGP